MSGGPFAKERGCLVCCGLSAKSRMRSLMKAFPEDRFVQGLKEEAIIKLFRAERLSSGYAAKLLGITRRDFFNRLEQHGVALATYGEGDLAADLDTLDRLRIAGFRLSESVYQAALRHASESH